MTLNLTQKEIDAWQQFIYDTTPGAEKQAATAPAQPVTNIYVFNVDNSVNIQAVVTPGNVPVQMVDERQRITSGLTKYLPSMYQPGNMEATAERLLKEKTGYR
jgi:hypothetical protein